MTESKTIEIDEITSSKEGANPNMGRSSSETKSKKSSSNPLSSLGWKALLTLKITRWFISLRSKSYGKWIIVPAVIIAVLLIVPIGIILAIWFSLKSLFAQKK